MPFQLTAPLQVSKQLTRTDAKYNKEGTPTFASFVQGASGKSGRRGDFVAALLAASERSDLRRSATEALAYGQTLSEEERHKFYEDQLLRMARNSLPNADIQIIEFSRLPRMNVYLTMVSCDIEKSEGVPLFRFKDGRLDMTEQEFGKAWDELPIEAIDDLHEICLEANPGWRPGGGEENSGKG